MMVEMYYDKDADLGALAGKTVAVIGYGSQGHAQAQNLRDSGINVIIAEVEGSPNWNTAVEHGFAPMSAAEAAKKADWIQMLVPDEVQPIVYEKELAPNMKPDVVYGCSHGFAIHFGTIVPPATADIVMIAPKGPGHLVRSEFEKGAGVPCLVAVKQDGTGKAKEMALAYAKGIGGTRAGVIETTFEEETETDLFGEQSVLCGGVSELVKAGFDTLVEAGYQPEIAYFECLHELKLIVDLFYQGGISYMYYSVSNTAEYGGLTRGPKIITDETRKAMKQMLADIKSGSFAKEWIAEHQGGGKNFKALEGESHDLLIEQVGRKLRKMMPWIDAKES
jgi:ketol-acid reductoisomerase